MKLQDLMDLIDLQELREANDYYNHFSIWADNPDADYLMIKSFEVEELC